MPADPVIRRATPRDAEELTRLRLALLREIGDVPDEATKPSLAAAIRRYFDAALERDEFVAWVAEADGRLVASSGLVFLARPPDAGNPAGADAYLMNMYTAPAWRGRGLARALLGELLRFARDSPARRVWLHASDAGRPLYARAGFVPTTADMELRW